MDLPKCREQSDFKIIQDIQDRLQDFLGCVNLRTLFEPTSLSHQY